MVCPFPSRTLKSYSSIILQLIIDKVGRKPMLLVGSVVMFSSMVIVGILVAKYQQDWPGHVAAGWSAVGE